MTPSGKSTNNRQSSVYHLPDPRPIKSTNFQSEEINLILTFLMNHEYPEDVSFQELQSPRTDRVKRLLTDLMSLIDPASANALARGEESFEKAVSGFFRRIHYPINMSVKALTAVNTSSTWPTVLAAMGWLVRLVQYQESLEARVLEDGNIMVTTTDGGNDSGKEHANLQMQQETEFAKIIIHSYHAFMSGDDERQEALKEQLKSGFEDRKRLAMKARDQVRLEVTDLKAKKKAMIEETLEPNKIGEESGKIREQISQCNESMAVLRKKLVENKAKEKRLETELIELQRDVAHEQTLTADIKVSIASQEMSSDQERQMKLEIDELKVKYRAAEKTLRSLEESKRLKDTELSHFDEGLNAETRKLFQMIERISKEMTSLGVSGYNDELLMDNSSQQRLKLQQTLQKIQSTIRNQLNSVRLEMVGLEGELHEFKETSNEITDQVNELKKAVIKKTKENTSLEENQKKELRLEQTKCETIEEEIESIHRKVTGNRKDGIWGQLEQARTRLAEQAKKHRAEEQDLDREIAKGLEIINDHKEKMKMMIDEAVIFMNKHLQIAENHHG
jgi:SMC interacting uncharacterized protein involved in chromosome segregation